VAERPYLAGYADRLTARAGEVVTVMAAAHATLRADVQLVRLGACDATGQVREQVVADLGEAVVRPQVTRPGSCVVVEGAARRWPAGAFAAACALMPTRLGRRQALFAQDDGTSRWWLGLDAEGRVLAEANGPGGACSARTGAPLVAGAWYAVAARFDPAGGLAVEAQPLPASASWRVAPSSAVVATRAESSAPAPLDGLLEAPLAIAASLDGSPAAWTECLDGKLEAPTLAAGPLDEALLAAVAGDLEALGGRLLARWDFEEALAGGCASGVAVPARPDPSLEGRLVNTPMLAVTGHAWDGREQDFRLAPRQYGAIHFHSDDLDDCRWEETLRVELPTDLPSGAYAVRLAGEGLVERVPVFVRPRGAPSADLLVLVPTASYLAYANDHPVSDGQLCQAVAGATPVLYEDDLVLHEHREWGLSCYDVHLDGSGVAYSSRLRPLLNMRPTHRYHIGPWQLPADLNLLSWLDAEGIPYDVATDEDLELEGTRLLAPYRAVVSGTHPEYYSTRMLDALEGYLDGGGRLVYIGANGYYWRIAFDRERPHVIEVRRGHAGSRAWDSAPGEVHLAFTGELGGMWRHLGRPPQRLTGVGYACQGFDVSGYYRRLPDSYDERVAFIFAGVEGETFGHAGAIGGGAVGQELDRYDASLGSPPDALVLATSEGLDESYRRCVEEIPFTVAGTSALLDPDARADVVYLVKPGGGAVFSTGSIAWCGALEHDGAIARITRNVLARFLDPAPLP